MWTHETVDIFTPSKSVILSTVIFEHQLFAGGMDGSVYIIDLQSRETTAVLKNHSRYVVKICISDDGLLLATAGYDKRISMFLLLLV